MNKPDLPLHQPGSFTRNPEWEALSRRLGGLKRSLPGSDQERAQILPLLLRGAPQRVIHEYTGFDTRAVERAKRWAIKNNRMVAASFEKTELLRSVDRDEEKSRKGSGAKERAEIIGIGANLFELGVLTADILVWQFIHHHYQDQGRGTLSFPDKIVMEGILNLRLLGQIDREVKLQRTLKKGGFDERFKDYFNRLNEFDPS